MKELIKKAAMFTGGVLAVIAIARLIQDKLNVPASVQKYLP